MTYRLELAKTNRSGCVNLECKNSGEKIAKGTLRQGVLVTIKEHQSWKWRHWGCVTPTSIANMNEVIDNNFDYLDGYDELSEDVQEMVRRAFEQGHVDDEDWRGDVEQNRPGAKGFRTPVKKPKKEKKRKAAQDDEGTGSPSKPAPKKRGRAKKEDASDADGTNQPPTKKTKAAAKKAKVTDPVDDDEAPPPKKARGRKKAVKKEDDDQDGAGSKDHAADPAENKAPNGTARKGSRGKKT
ncbi:hypothetical protein G7Y79_00002g006380 [Physcia stellaris]|nr:hypothetical protein G7Y79_00002g006380 [Physcia stellaris]